VERFTPWVLWELYLQQPCLRMMLLSPHHLTMAEHLGNTTAHPLLIPSPAGVVEPMSLELDEESDEELEQLAAVAGAGPHDVPLSPGGASGPLAAPGGTDELRAQRFVLLRDLWASAH
jgi:hypothetical protein